VKGFSHLSRSSKSAKQNLDRIEVEKDKSNPLGFAHEVFNSSNAGILMFLASIRH